MTTIKPYQFLHCCRHLLCNGLNYLWSLLESECTLPPICIKGKGTHCGYSLQSSEFPPDIYFRFCVLVKMGDEVVLITGCSRGIGLGLVDYFAKAGYKVNSTQIKTL